MQPYFVYHNWTAEKGSKPIIHQGSCSFCNNGQGVHYTGPTRNGRWLGPFETKNDALAKARDTEAARVDYCKKCNP